ncbi:hypothetical protein [Pseudobacteroides cellulosolvens]|uniref:Uncharacterized protein n=1 Tax=Pseudobacteroides cellulosolvens ATCC 35603 = DSM 2933 TaxID=398512 RepID=A0A0L6JGJ5_9FIRM|nr:hypothetical protein [Pseudobacteroides cellulosolvens]KNY24829.1 hypothetical protein Bccel_0086 [Pseudobacteroides cellulosolvens ATCC 35603 = DSM 2933]
MKIWEVKMPVAGYVKLEIEADDYQEAIQKAWNKMSDTSNDEFMEHVETLSVLDKLADSDSKILSDEVEVYKIETHCIEDPDNF